MRETALEFEYLSLVSSDGNFRRVGPLSKANQAIADEAKRLADKHFKDVAEMATQHCDDFGENPIDWDELDRDLRRCPAMAMVSVSVGGWPLLFFAIMLPDVPLFVIQKLLSIYPSALFECDDDFGWNVFNVMQQANPEYLSLRPEILECILKGNPRAVIVSTEEGEFSDQIPLDDYIKKDSNSPQVKAILKFSPYAVGLVLLRYFRDENSVPATVLTLALSSAESFEFSGQSIINLDLDTSRDEHERDNPEKRAEHKFGFILLKELTKERIPAFHKVTKPLVKGGLRGIDHDAEGQISSCVLYVATKMNPKERPTDGMWKTLLRPPSLNSRKRSLKHEESKKPASSDR